VINKTLKDVVTRFGRCRDCTRRTCRGGDCHGLPIEHKIQEELQKKHGTAKFQEMTPLEIRKECFAYARSMSKYSRGSFRGWG